MTHEEAIEAARAVYWDCTNDPEGDRDMSKAIQAYLSASGMVLVPREPDEKMHKAWEDGYYKGFDDLPNTTERLSRTSAFHCFTTAHQSMIEAAPSPFKSNP